MERPTSPDTAILTTDHLTREVSGRRVVNDVSVHIRRGDVLAVAGPSGAGKSSFLRLLNRLDEPTGGTVWFDGRDYREMAPRELRRRVGMVTQTPYLFPGSIEENLRFGPLQQRLELPAKNVEQLLAEVGLAGLTDANVHHLSGGEAQRVALARALANSPSVLLLDEPTSALDQNLKRGIEELVLKVVTQNALTCVLVTHDLAQAERMASRVMLLDGGKLVRCGLTREVLGAQASL